MRRAALVGLGGLLLGCASYGPLSESARGGYTDRMLSPGIHEVSFYGTLAQEQLDDLALLRAAQLTLERGYGSFVVDPIWLPGGDGRARLVIEVRDEAAGIDPIRVYDAAEVQARLLGRYRSLGIPPVARRAEPAADPCP